MPIIHVTFKKDADSQKIGADLIVAHDIAMTDKHKERFERFGALTGWVLQTGEALDELLVKIKSVEGVNQAVVDGMQSAQQKR